jgi:PIN domain nuclease of toxin-antitoxin system
MAIESFQLVDVTPSLFIDSCFLPGKLSRDPGDRIIVATARENDLTILTRDRKILDYSTAGHVLALAC